MQTTANTIKDKFGNVLFLRRLSGLNGGQKMLISNKEIELLQTSVDLELNGNKKDAEKLNIQIRKLRSAAEKLEARF